MATGSEAIRPRNRPVQAGRGRRGRPARARLRAPWWLAAIVAAAGKAPAIADLVLHRGALVPILAVGLAISVLRVKPLAFCAGAAALFAVALAPPSALLGVGLGLGAFVVLLTAFVAIGTLLQARAGERPWR